MIILKVKYKSIYKVIYHIHDIYLLRESLKCFLAPVTNDKKDSVNPTQSGELVNQSVQTSTLDLYRCICVNVCLYRVTEKNFSGTPYM